MGKSIIKVAYADDNIMVRRTYRAIFTEESDLEIIGEAANGEELIKLIHDKKPDVAILDIIMPKIDGLDVIRRVMTDDDIKKKPVFIAVSAIGDDRITKEAFATGAQYFIMKPLSREVLIERIHWALESEHKAQNVQMLKNQGSFNDMEIRVADVLYRLGMPVHIIGHRFMRDAIIMAMEDVECISSITKLLYPDVAKKNKTTPTRVERAMRHAVEVVWARGDKSCLARIFERPLQNLGVRPTNSEFVARMSEYIIMEMAKDGLNEAI